MTDPLDIIRKARLPETVHPVCLAGHLLAEIDVLREELRKVRPANAPRRLNTVSREAELAEQIDALREEMQANTVNLRMRALPKDEWRRLVEKHPARRNNKLDAQIGVNSETFFPELIRVSVIDPALEDDDVTTLLAALNNGEFEALSTVAFGLNRGGVAVPLSPSVSETMQRTDDA